MSELSLAHRHMAERFYISFPPNVYHETARRQGRVWGVVQPLREEWVNLGVLKLDAAHCYSSSKPERKPRCYDEYSCESAGFEPSESVILCGAVSYMSCGIKTLGHD
eukprot:scaffold165665_cov18-Prasinocladus_malaysianus.AAC.1